MTDNPLQRIELKIRLWPIPVFDEEITFQIDKKENQGFVKEFYDCLIEPMVKSHLDQLTMELQGMGLAFDLIKKAEEMGIDPVDALNDKEVRRKIWEQEEKEMKNKDGEDGV